MHIHTYLVNERSISLDLFTWGKQYKRSDIYYSRAPKWTFDIYSSRGPLLDVGGVLCEVTTMSTSCCKCVSVKLPQKERGVEKGGNRDSDDN
jgi:hypothetical protein